MICIKCGGFKTLSQENLGENRKNRRHNCQEDSHECRFATLQEAEVLAARNRALKANSLDKELMCLALALLLLPPSTQHILGAELNVYSHYLLTAHRLKSARVSSLFTTRSELCFYYSLRFNFAGELLMCRQFIATMIICLSRKTIEKRKRVFRFACGWWKQCLWILNT